MATRSRIGIEMESGAVESIYCHWDGYLEGVGVQLLLFYSDTESVRSLLARGSVAELASSVEESRFFEDTDGSTTDVNRQDYVNSAEGEEYLYLWTEWGWSVYIVGEGWYNLADLLIVEANEEED